jgi:hypothetical protein
MFPSHGIIYRPAGVTQLILETNQQTRWLCFCVQSLVCGVDQETTGRNLSTGRNYVGCDR